MPLAGQPHSAHGADRRDLRDAVVLPSPVSVVPVPDQAWAGDERGRIARWPFAAVVASVSSAGRCFGSFATALAKLWSRLRQRLRPEGCRVPPACAE